MKKTFLRLSSRLIALGLAASLAAGGFSAIPVFAADTPSQATQQEQYAAQQAENNRKLASLRQDKAQKAAYVATLQSQLDAIEEQINGYSNQMTDLGLQIQKSNAVIAKKQQAIQEDTQKLKARLCALYTAGGAGNLELLLSATDLVDLADKTEAVSMVTAHDTALINRLKADKKAVETEKAAIVAKQQRVADTRNSVSTKQQQLSETLQEAQQFLQEIGQTESSIQAQNASLDVQAAKVAAALQAAVPEAKQNANHQDNAAASNPKSNAPSERASSKSDDTYTDSDTDATPKHQSKPGNQSSSGNTGSNRSSFARLISEAEKYLGTPYVMGGSSPSGFDCSGFVSYVFSHAGVCNIPRTTAQGIYNMCQSVSIANAQPGDIVFFSGTYNCGETVTHVGIYVGSNTMIHAGGGCVQYTSLDSSYWQQHLYGFGRV